MPIAALKKFIKNVIDKFSNKPNQGKEDSEFKSDIVDTPSGIPSNFISGPAKINPEVFTHNVEMLKHLADTRDKQAFVDALGSIKVLRQVKILKKLGSGIQKTGFLLQNDHVFVIATRYVSGYNDNMQKPLDILKGIQDRMFSGKGSKHDFMVYDFGEFTEPDVNFWWAELSQVIPLAVYYDIYFPNLRHTRYSVSSIANRVISNIKRAMMHNQKVHYYDEVTGKPTKEDIKVAFRDHETKKALNDAASAGHQKR